jgi:hypothetical protein
MLFGVTDTFVLNAGCNLCNNTCTKIFNRRIKKGSISIYMMQAQCQELIELQKMDEN